MTSKPDFEHLRRKRDENVAAWLQDLKDNHGVDTDIAAHVSALGCYCDCAAGGPCEHEFKGWREFEDGRGGEQVCEKCGTGAMRHSMRTGW